MNNDFKVLTVLRTGGEYLPAHVCWLQRQIGMPIYCLTDSKVEMKDVISIPLKYNWPLWWSKIEMFRPDLALTNFLYTDLDTVFLNGIPEKYKTLCKTVVLADVSMVRPNREPNPRMNSGLMFLTGEENKQIWYSFESKAQEVMGQFQKAGDQGYLDQFLRNAARWQTLFPGEIKSYKSNLQGKPLSGNETIIVFHGEPRPFNGSKVGHNKWIPVFRNE